MGGQRGGRIRLELNTDAIKKIKIHDLITRIFVITGKQLDGIWYVFEGITVDI